MPVSLFLLVFRGDFWSFMETDEQKRSDNEDNPDKDESGKRNILNECFMDCDTVPVKVGIILKGGTCRRISGKVLVELKIYLKYI